MLLLLVTNYAFAKDAGVFGPECLTFGVGNSVGHSRDRGLDTGKGEGVFVSHVNPFEKMRLLKISRS